MKKRNKPLSNRERRKLKGKAERAAERAFRREWPFIAVAQNACGCCQVEMKFKSRESAIAAFTKAGLGHGPVTDDAGEVHDSVDTFYGFQEKAKKGETPGRGLDYLFGLVTGQKKWP